MSNNILLKKDCINVVKPENYFIHPLVNKIGTNDNKNKNICLTIPFIDINKIAYMDFEDKLKNKNIEINLDLNQTKNDVSKIPKILDPILNFTFPINSNNFLEIVFGITSIQKLYEWLENYDLNDVKNINLILNLFWSNNGIIISENINEFVLFNQKLIKLMFDTNIDINNVSKIVDKLVKHKYGKKIKYLHKIKKYLTEYI